MQPSTDQFLPQVALVYKAKSTDETRMLADFYIPLAPGQYQLFDFEAFAEIGENGYNSTKEWLEKKQTGCSFSKISLEIEFRNSKKEKTG